MLDKAAETPDDETWRGVVADWLEERGLEDERVTVALGYRDHDDYIYSLNACLRAFNVWLKWEPASSCLVFFVNRIRGGDFS